MWKTVLTILAIVTFLFFAALFLGVKSTEGYIEEKIEALGNNPGDNAEFPRRGHDILAKTERLIQISADTNKSAKFLKIKMKGFFKTNAESEWKEVSAEENFSIENPGFVWNAKISASSIFWVTAVDSYTKGKGEFLIKLLSSLKVTELSGDEIDISGLIRYYSEAVFFPRVLRSRNIKWLRETEKMLAAEIEEDGKKFRMNYYFNSKGLIVKATSPDKFRTTRTGYQKSNYIVEFKNYKEMGNHFIPTQLEMKWKLGDSDFSFGKFEILEAEYSDKILKQ